MATTWAAAALQAGWGVLRERSGEGNVSLTQLLWTESSSNEGRVEVLCQSHMQEVLYCTHKNTQSETTRNLFTAFSHVC